MAAIALFIRSWIDDGHAIEFELVLVDQGFDDRATAEQYRFCDALLDRLFCGLEDFIVIGFGENDPLGAFARPVGEGSQEGIVLPKSGPKL